MSIRALPLVLMLLIAAIGAGCSEQEEPTVVLDKANLTVEEVYARFAEAINRPGSIYQVTIDMDHDGGYFAMEATRRLWVDVGRDLVREEGDGEMRWEEETVHYEWRSITAGGGVYKHDEQPQDESDPDSKVEARTCHGGSAAVSAVLGCPAWREESTAQVETGKYGKHSAVIVVTTGTRHGEAGKSIFTDRLYLDGSTLLPIAYESEGTLDDSLEVKPFDALWSFNNRFLPERSLSDDFFDPASIGYVEHDPEEPLESDLGITVYWLGRRFEAGGGLPPLALQDARAPDSEEEPSYRVTLYYRLAEDEFGPWVIELQEWDLDEWGASSRHSALARYWDRPCRDREEVVFPAGRATIFMEFRNEGDIVEPATPGGTRICPDRPYDRFRALAYLSSTVILVDAPGAVTDGSHEDSPYDTLEGMEAVLNGLHPRG
jgi:hypothetical protein